MTNKDINANCPLSAECEQKSCRYISHELDCVYYRELEDTAIDEIIDDIKDDIATSQSHIVMLPVDDLFPHPDNPRKDVGDVTELAESIKANGILQNLTVVPSPRFHGQYIVVIGHRRLAASKVAGLEKVPCVIAGMSPEEQIATMLTENMQRADLTVYEQAKAFQQLSLDLGMSVTEIADMSGFSETTVRRRTKLADLDEKAFKKACDRGATLFDFAELEKLDDPAAKQKCLEAMGTNNFKNELRNALDAQKYKRRAEKWIEQLNQFATKIEKCDYVGDKYVHMNYYRNYGSWTRDEDITKPDNADTVRYFFTVSGIQISLYVEDVKDPDREKAAAEKERIRKKDEEDWEKANEIAFRHKVLRKEFVAGFDAAKSNMPIILRNLADVMLSEGKREGYVNVTNMSDLADVLGISFDKEKKQIDRDAFNKIKNERPEFMTLALAYWYYEKCGSYIEHKWVADLQRYVISYRDNQKLDNLYYFLEELGYERSDEEIQLSRGTHELFWKEGD